MMPDRTHEFALRDFDSVKKEALPRQYWSFDCRHVFAARVQPVETCLSLANKLLTTVDGMLAALCIAVRPKRGRPAGEPSGQWRVSQLV